jgi:hypothetical protein
MRTYLFISLLFSAAAMCAENECLKDGSAAGPDRFSQGGVVTENKPTHVTVDAQKLDPVITGLRIPCDDPMWKEPLAPVHDLYIVNDFDHDVIVLVTISSANNVAGRYQGIETRLRPGARVVLNGVNRNRMVNVHFGHRKTLHVLLDDNDYPEALKHHLKENNEGDWELYLKGWQQRNVQDPTWYT